MRSVGSRRRFGDSHDLGFACGRCGSRIANWVEFVWVCGCFHLPTPQISRRDSGQLAVGKRIATYGFDVTRHADREAGHRIPSGRTGALYRLGRRTGSSHRGPRDHGGQRARARRFQVALSVASECGIARAWAATPEGSRKRLAHPTGGIASAQPPANRCHALGVVMDVAVPPHFPLHRRGFVDVPVCHVPVCHVGFGLHRAMGDLILRSLLAAGPGSVGVSLPQRCRVVKRWA